MHGTCQEHAEELKIPAEWHTRCCDCPVIRHGGHLSNVRAARVQHKPATGRKWGHNPVAAIDGCNFFYEHMNSYIERLCAAYVRVFLLTNYLCVVLAIGPGAGCAERQRAPVGDRGEPA